uniref:Uncharacterized protein n=1 Tax=Strombidium inclinatum TaxID=197538 RepID=A0A7S3IHD8_9SPIT|mmetsp:Transcript_19431/g.29868  ORF Transcript_19431/g.29868 Transcript_19431/m.29868 type:complete len:174 (+) Transcript_19431:1009-1530(+)
MLSMTKDLGSVLGFSTADEVYTYMPDYSYDQYNYYLGQIIIYPTNLVETITLENTSVFCIFEMFLVDALILIVLYLAVKGCVRKEFKDSVRREIEPNSDYDDTFRRGKCCGLFRSEEELEEDADIKQRLSLGNLYTRIEQSSTHREILRVQSQKLEEVVSMNKQLYADMNKIN